jgi:putative ABC transport system permease protein
MNDFLSQAAAITTMNLRSLSDRKTPAIVAIIGIMGAVVVLIGMLAISEGFRGVLDRAGATDVAVVLRGGSNDEFGSSLTGQQTQIIADQPLVLRAEGEPLASAELYVVTDVPMRNSNTPASLPLRGVGPQGPKLHRHFKMVQGRYFAPGTFEMVVGRSAALQYAQFDLGSRVRLGTTDWSIVGIFEDNGSVSESEAWTSAGVLQSAYQRGSTFQSVRLQLGGADALQSLTGALKRDPRLNVNVYTEREFYEALSRPLLSLARNVGSVIALLMGIGAVFGALNTMYSTVAARTREIATLRAIGFGSGPVIVSVLSEAIAIGVLGGALGGLVGWLGFDGVRAATLNPATWAQLTFKFDVTPELLAHGLLYAVVLAFVGGLAPSVRAARLPIATGLRET